MVIEEDKVLCITAKNVAYLSDGVVLTALCFDIARENWRSR